STRATSVVVWSVMTCSLRGRGWARPRRRACRGTPRPPPMPRPWPPAARRRGPGGGSARTRASVPPRTRYRARWRTSPPARPAPPRGSCRTSRQRGTDHVLLVPADGAGIDLVARHPVVAPDALEHLARLLPHQAVVQGDHLGDRVAFQQLREQFARLVPLAVTELVVPGAGQAAAEVGVRGPWLVGFQLGEGLGESLHRRRHLTLRRALGVG